MKNLSKEELLSRLEAINRSNAIIYFDLSGIILGVNDIFLVAMGYGIGNHDELIGKHHSTFVCEEYAKSPEYEKFWDISCANSYSDNIPFFVLAIQDITGYIPTLIKGDGLPLERQDIFGTIYEHKEDLKRKIIPIKIISEKIGTIEGVEIYGKSKVETI